MPLQNRVDPWGQLNAVPSKAATRMGNRGILHDDNRKIVKQWAHKSWVLCLLSFKEIERGEPFSKGNYSELFFLDEATAFSAGHRPCAYCQRERNQLFKEAWLRANVTEKNRSEMSWPEIDKALHGERAIRGGDKQTYDATLSNLPNGAMFEHNGKAFLVSNRRLLPWSFDGYGSPVVIAATSSVRVLTPSSTVRAFMNGFEPLLHSTANG